MWRLTQDGEVYNLKRLFEIENNKKDPLWYIKYNKVVWNKPSWLTLYYLWIVK